MFSCAVLLLSGAAGAEAPADPAGVTEIGSRRELFVDDALVERLGAPATLRLHSPQIREIALVHDKPWEGSGSGYHSIFKDGDVYRMYYKAWQLTVTPGKVGTDEHPLYCCYAESPDGIHWRKPELGLHEFQGSKANNIVLVSTQAGKLDYDAGHPAVFRDTNPQAAPDARYKAFLRSRTPRGLLAFKSPDGLHWSPMSDTPVITDGAFDSQNLAFWDETRGEYRAYWRYFDGGTAASPFTGVRAIRTAVSQDFLHWTHQADLLYPGSPPEHLYTNQIQPYFRAPHLFVGFPVRYIDRGWSESMRALPEREHREYRASAKGSGGATRYGTAITEGLFMSSRDGVTFQRWNEAFLRPGIERPGTWNYGHQYAGWQLVPTKSDLEGAPDELSLYTVESYWTGDSSVLRRYTLRMDGFVSLHAPMSGGELVTRPIRFRGDELVLNFSSSAAGAVQVELQDPAGRPYPGFALADCPPMFGDTLERAVTWTSGRAVSALAGRPVRLRFVLADADVYAFQFRSAGK